MVNRVGTVYPSGSKKSTVRDSVWTSEFDIKQVKKAEEHIGRVLYK